ncbi:gephyrin-like molybdotransferase receptor GlpR [Corynebacterium appendicis]|uniref:divisome protein SepX/GlpR n=1 Tax=Corynebacterium appendicis TaxID=163202 RepID=UPI0023524FC6|nr:gephyrin-like molybdotransferase receptor GlpR [Corynebacterium appendicis]
MSGSLSLIIVLIVVVWAIVLAPMVLGDSKPIRRSGEGYDETRVLHQGNTPLAARRRPRVTKDDIHSFDEDDDYDVLDEEAVLIDDTLPETSAAPADEPSSGSTSLKKLIDGEIVEEAETAPEAEAEVEAESEPEIEAADASEYELDASYLSPEDYGYTTVTQLEEKEEESEAETQAEDLTETAEPTEDELAFARARRGGWDPEMAKRVREDRFRRRQRTLLGLVVLFGISFVFGIVSGGWAWLAPAAAAGLLAWYMTALRTTVKKERALQARRVRQLRRARLGVVTAAEDAPVPPHMRRPGAVVVEVDDESADFANLPTYTVPREESERIREIA